MVKKHKPLKVEFLAATYSPCCGDRVTIKGRCFSCREDLRAVLKQFNEDEHDR